MGERLFPLRAGGLRDSPVSPPTAGLGTARGLRAPAAGAVPGLGLYRGCPGADPGAGAVPGLSRGCPGADPGAGAVPGLGLSRSWPYPSPGAVSGLALSRAWPCPGVWGCPGFGAVPGLAVSRSWACSGAVPVLALSRAWPYPGPGAVPGLAPSRTRHSQLGISSMSFLRNRRRCEQTALLSPVPAGCADTRGIPWRPLNLCPGAPSCRASARARSLGFRRSWKCRGAARVRAELGDRSGKPDLEKFSFRAFETE